MTASADPDRMPARRRGPGRSALRSVSALMLREMATRYGRSPGGYLWAVLEPVGAIVVIALALSFIIRVPPLGNSFLLFYASGYLPFLVYSLLQASVAQALGFSRPLLMYPVVSWIDAILARFLLNLLTCVAVIGIVLAGVVWFTDAGAVPRPGLLIASVALMAGLGLGHGTLNCLLVGLFPAWAQVWSILSRPLMVAAGVFFVMEDLPDTAREVLWWTPWIHATSLFRAGLYGTYEPAFVSVMLVGLWAALPLVAGLALLRRYRQDIVMASG